MMQKIVVLVVGLSLGLSGIAAAAALDNTHMGSKANAMGKAFTGLADDPSAVFYNPAGLVFQREGLSVQAYGLYGMTDLTYTGATFPKASFPAQVVADDPAYANKSDEAVLFPGFFLNYRKGDTAFGLGLYVPYGGGKYKYENYRGLTGMTVEQSLGLIAFGGSMSLQLVPKKFSIGMSLTGYLGQYSFKKTLPTTLIPAQVTALGGSQEDSMSAIAAVGGNFGLMYKASDSLSFGATAKLPVRITVNGDTTFGSTSYESGAELRLPWYVTLGMALKAGTDLTLTFDFNYGLYSTMDKYTFFYRGYPDTTGAITDVRTGYTDATYLALGADYKLGDALSLRGGVTFTPNATLDDAVSLSCDVTHLTYALGAGYKFADAFELMLSVHYLMGFERTVDGKTGVTGATGEQKFLKNVFMVMAGVNVNL